MARNFSPPAFTSLTMHSANTAGELLIGNSPPIKHLRQQIDEYADSPFPVLIEGESGTGKELVARSLHQSSKRPALFPVNCAALPAALLESTLFGHTRGAFTGAETARTGLFEEAGEGTLFLDEIAELPIELQAKLLRVLENGEFRRIGETALRHSHARIVAASNRNLHAEVSAGRFRADLFHRLNILSLQVPPLRQLGHDKILLLRHFRKAISLQISKPEFDLTDQATGWLEEYPFPGNVRELRNLVIRLLTRFPGRALDTAQVQDELACSHKPTASEPSSLSLQSSPDGINLDDILNLQARHYIASALAKTQGNISIAARLLGIPRSTLCSRMAALDIVRK